MLNGIDISNWQKTINLTAVPHAILGLKLTEGRGYVDPAWRDLHRQNREGHGRDTAFYHFVSQGNTPEAEGENFVREFLTADPRPGDCAVLDWEPVLRDGRPGTDPAPGDVEWARRWLAYVEPRIGKRPWIYMNLSTANAYDWGDIAANHPLWLAHYPGNNRADGYTPAGARGQLSQQWKRLVGWQFTDGGRLPGYSGDLDLNEFYIEPGRMCDWAGNRPQEDPITTITIPELRENDPPVTITMRGGTFKGCLCMAITLPLIEQAMLDRGLIKYNLDIFQGGYNAGGVAASAGTHDMGGVIDVGQYTLEQRKVWAEFGVMMFPRTAGFGWRGGEHGHGVWHGCPHQTASADKQVRDGIAGYDGLVSNTYRDFEHPTRTWQEAVQAITSPAPAQAAPAEEQNKGPNTDPYTPASRTVYVSKLKRGQRDSDSVYWVQKALNAVSLVGGSTIVCDGHYGDQTAHEAGLFQAQKCGDPADGELGPKQTARLRDLSGVQFEIR